MYAANGDMLPAAASASSAAGEVASWKVTTASHTNIPMMMAMRTRVARRRFADQAPTVNRAMNTAMFPAYSSGMRRVTAAKYAAETTTATVAGQRRRTARGTARAKA